MNSTTFITTLKLRSTRELRRTRSKILLLMLTSGSVCMQASNNDSAFKLKAAVAVVGVAVTGVTLWRMTAPSDKAVLINLNQAIIDKELAKYSADFDTGDKPRVNTKEDQIAYNLVESLKYSNVNQQLSNIQMQLDTDGRELRSLKEGIWFRSFFNSDVSNKYHELGKFQSKAESLKPYFKHHENYFKGLNLCKEHQEFAAKAQADGDWVHCIRKTYIGDKTYPLMYVAGKYLQDVAWINGFRKNVYPQLDARLDKTADNAINVAVWLKDRAEYDHEQENKRQQDVVDAQLLAAQAQLLAAQSASRQADAATRNAQTEQKRLALETENNERARIEARVAALQRCGYSQRQIQQQLNREGFTQALIKVILGN